VVHTAPLHYQLVTELKKLLRERGFPPGAQFLTEREIAERFTTSRATANKALTSLASEGLLEFRHGAGTFVREGVLDYDLQRLVSFTDKAVAAGRTPTTRVLTFRRLKAEQAPAEVAAMLQASPGETLFHLARLRLADGVPVILERRHVLARHCPTMTRADAAGSLYAFWTGDCQLHLSGASESIRAVNATTDEARSLAVPAGTACLLVVAVGTLTGGAPLWHEETLYRSDLYEFRNQLGGIVAARPAVGRMRPARSLA
jgi:GntR family transcriptional regulator